MSRHVFAELEDGSQIVRYSDARRWAREWPHEAMVPMAWLSVGAAVRLTVRNATRVHYDLPGGRRFYSAIEPDLHGWEHLARLEHTSIRLRCHDPAECAGRPCTLHNRTDHPMRQWQQLWRDDRGIMERWCEEHSCGHPDPDEIPYWRIRFAGDEARVRAELVHGCCGCCGGYV